MPALFAGHGFPHNLLAVNPASEAFASLSSLLPRPSAILVLSAHWVTPDLRVTSGEHPRQLYDYLNAPDEFYTLRCSPPGDTALPMRIALMLTASGYACTTDDTRGFDHAAWGLMHRIFPDYAIPLVELSLDYKLSPARWFEIGKALSPLRDEGVLVIGAGNVVHNIYKADRNPEVPAEEWALKFNELVKKAVEEGDRNRIANWALSVEESRLAVPTPDHFLPLLFVMGTMNEGEKAELFHESFQNGTVAMTSFLMR
jgi:4,5-DOPA dioxygenase extradiol